MPKIGRHNPSPRPLRVRLDVEPTPVAALNIALGDLAEVESSIYGDSTATAMMHLAGIERSYRPPAHEPTEAEVLAMYRRGIASYRPEGEPDDPRSE